MSIAAVQSNLEKKASNSIYARYILNITVTEL